MLDRISYRHPHELPRHEGVNFDLRCCAPKAELPASITTRCNAPLVLSAKVHPTSDYLTRTCMAAKGQRSGGEEAEERNTCVQSHCSTFLKYPWKYRHPPDHDQNVLLHTFFSKHMPQLELEHLTRFRSHVAHESSPPRLFAHSGIVASVAFVIVFVVSA